MGAGQDQLQCIQIFGRSLQPLLCAALRDTGKGSGAGGHPVTGNAQRRKAGIFRRSGGNVAQIDDLLERNDPIAT